MTKKHIPIRDELKSAGILVVDDEPANVKLVCRMLDVFGYTNVVSTTDPQMAVGLALQQSSNLVILDLNMPIMNGFEVMAKLQELESPPSILVLTAQSSMENRILALNEGASDFLPKPFDNAELVARVRNLLEANLYQLILKNENEGLAELVRLKTQELNDTRLDIIRRLGRAAEYRDNETGMHIIRMSRYSQMLGLKAGLSKEHAEILLEASPMHDIGKIGIPDEILLKPGKLESHEWEIMKTHAQIGADLLDNNDAPLIKMAKQIALTHHEKWDGSGYPNGLKGEDIPLEGRIVAIADVFDALTSERPYKKAWSLEDALSYLKEQADSQFDPNLVDLFMEVVDEVKLIMEEYPEEVH